MGFGAQNSICAQAWRPWSSFVEIDRIPVCGIFESMIKSFGDRRTEALFEDELVRAFHGFADRAKRKLVAINVAARLEDLRVPPANRLEKLRGDLEGFYSIRINDQWRVVFRWADGDAHGVRIVDYH